MGCVAIARRYVLFNLDYTVRDNVPHIYLFARDANGDRKTFVVNTYKPYFYAPASEAKSVDGLTYTGLDGSKCVRVETDLPRYVAAARKEYSQTWEADILFPLRYIIDKGIRAGFEVRNGALIPADDMEDVKPKISYTDIEVEITEKGTAPDPRTAQNLILSTTTMISDPNKDREELFVFTATDESEEKRMLEEWLELQRREDVDIHTGWNVFFDLAHLIGRMKRLGVHYHQLSPMNFVEIRGSQQYMAGLGDIIKILGVTVLDLLTAFAKYWHGKRLDSYRLQDILASEQYGFGKEPDFFDEDLWNRYHMDVVLAKNENDVVYLAKLDKKWGIIDHFDSVRRVVGSKLDDALTTSRYFKILMLRNYHGHYTLPTKVHRDKKREKYEGAYVIQPGKGVFENVIMIDFAAMYPSAVISFNMSPETITNDPNEDAFEVDNVRFKKSPRGICPKTFEDLIGLRKKLKEELRRTPKDDPRERRLWEMQYGVKQITAAMYGQFGFPGSVIFEPRIARSITAIGRESLKLAIGLVKEEGYNVAYGDTDSLLIQIPPEKDAVAEGQRLEALINEHFLQKAEQTGQEKPMHVELDTIYRRLIFSGKKKRYAGLAVWEKGRKTHEVVVKGFEIRRSDSSIVSRRAQKMIFDLVLNEENHRDAESSIRKMVKDLFGQVPQLSIEEAGIPKPIRKFLVDYKNPGNMVPIHYANKMLGKSYDKGSRPFTFWLRSVPVEFSPVIEVSGKSYHVNRIALETTEELDNWREYIDWDRQLQAVVSKKLEPILDAYGLTMSEILSDQTQTMLETFI